MVESLQEMEFRKLKEKVQRLERRNNLENLTDEELKSFIWDMHRYETDENQRVYIKGIRSCLLALGYSEEFVNGHFYEKILEEYR